MSLSKSKTVENLKAAFVVNLKQIDVTYILPLKPTLKDLMMLQRYLDLQLKEKLDMLSVI